MYPTKLILIFLILISPLISARECFAANTELYYFSDPGDYIGQGEEVDFTQTDGQFTISPNFGNSINFSFTSNGFEHWWNLSLSAPNQAPLQVGSYENTQRFPFQEPGHPGLDFSGDGRGCNQSSGRFDVLEIVQNANGEVLKLAVNFEQHCELGEPAIYGQVRFNSDVPLSGKPIQIKLINPLNINRCVEASSPNGATIGLEAKEIKDANGGDSVEYEWSTTSGAISTGPLFSFVAPIKGLNQSPIIATLTITDLTNNTKKSATKAVCVSDTTAPSIVINSPRSGQLIDGKNVILDISIKDTVDKKINQYSVQIGSNFVSPINPQTGRSRQRINTAPRVNGAITTDITIKANDVYGNIGQQTVTVQQIP